MLILATLGLFEILPKTGVSSAPNIQHSDLAQGGKEGYSTRVSIYDM